MKKIILIVLIFISTLLLGCQYDSKAQQIDIDALKLQITSINYQLSTLQSDITAIQVKNTFKQIGFFNPASASNGYANIESNGYIFPVMLDKIIKSPGGYEADFSIGNPYACIFLDVTVNVSWGETWDSETSLQKNSINIPILPIASWTSFKVILSPADDASIQTIAVKINYDKLRLSVQENN